MSNLATLPKAGAAAFDRADPVAVRHAARAGLLTTHTGALAPGFVQANMAILPKSYADEFLLFCQRNPQPCPILGMSEPGDGRVPNLGADLDVRTDLPGYRVFRDGEAVEDVTDIRHLWQDDFVAFLLGCSYSFESAMVDAGLPLRHWETGAEPPIYKTSIDCRPAGRFAGKMVVSMRPFRAADAIRAIQITSRFPNVHGAPVHIGRPDLIGIDDLENRFGGDAPDVREDEVPLFWACGVTPQVVVKAARPPICITHKPAHMLITDLRNAALASL
jgi:uncharacterized protein YcsI (UPF0317 family)